MEPNTGCKTESHKNRNKPPHMLINPNECERPYGKPKSGKHPYERDYDIITEANNHFNHLVKPFD